MLLDSFGALKKLCLLSLSHVGINSLPHTFGELSNLKMLNFDGCSMLNMLRDLFGGLEKMYKLTLRYLGISGLPHIWRIEQLGSVELDIL